MTTRPAPCSATASSRVTPDGRYIVVRGRLWRASNPHLTLAQRQSLVQQLMDARRAVGRAKRAGDALAEKAAHAAVDAAKVSLGERGDPLVGRWHPRPESTVGEKHQLRRLV